MTTVVGKQSRDRLYRRAAFQGQEPSLPPHMQNMGFGTAEENARRDAAKRGSHSLLMKMLKYGAANNGLPNLSPDDCRARLNEMVVG